MGNADYALIFGFDILQSVLTYILGAFLDGSDEVAVVAVLQKTAVQLVNNAYGLRLTSFRFFQRISLEVWWRVGNNSSNNRCFRIVCKLFLKIRKKDFFRAGRGFHNHLEFLVLYIKYRCNI